MLVRAGRLTAYYQSGSLRPILHAQKEVLRHVYVAIRDEHWNTAPLLIVRESVETSSDIFSVDLEAESELGEVHFRWRLTIQGGPDSFIRWKLSGKPRRSFRRNRIGFCVLHPIEGCAGEPCVVEHVDGSREASLFPRFVAPHQPFLDVRALSHEVCAGVTAEVRFSGDIFETEDQRNWTDQSFKTYSTPLSLPYPVMVGPDDHVDQEVTLSLIPAHEPDVEITAGDGPSQAAPELGLIASVGILAGASFIRTDIDCQLPDWRETLANTAQSPLSREIALFTDDPQDLQDLRPMATVRRWLIFSADGTITKPDALSAARLGLGDDAKIGGGSNTNFAELNRNRRSLGPADFLAWAVNPLVHATDEQTMIENLEAQPETVYASKHFSNGVNVAISPVRVPSFAGRESWIVASISQLAQAGVMSIAYDTASPVFEEIAAFAPEQVLHVTSSAPLRAYALALRSGARVRTWMVNLTSKHQHVLFQGRRLRLSPYEVRSFDMAA